MSLGIRSTNHGGMKFHRKKTSDPFVKQIKHTLETHIKAFADLPPTEVGKVKIKVQRKTYRKYTFSAKYLGETVLKKWSIKEAINSRLPQTANLKLDDKTGKGIITFQNKNIS